MGVEQTEPKSIDHATAESPHQKLAAALLTELERQELIELSSAGARARLVEDLSDLLGRLDAVPKPGATLGEWLVDHDAVDDVFATDDQLEALLRGR